jgi:hypothetical protein
MMRDKLSGGSSAAVLTHWAVGCPIFRCATSDHLKVVSERDPTMCDAFSAGAVRILITVENIDCQFVVNVSEKPKSFVVKLQNGMETHRSHPLLATGTFGYSRAKWLGNPLARKHYQNGALIRYPDACIEQWFSTLICGHHLQEREAKPLTKSMQPTCATQLKPQCFQRIGSLRRKGSSP